ncbi:head maturation protease, ClpP-related [Pseudomonas sp. OV546]|uniref:head maturation protease, ClpP-related n=1 Tax=Pseudomonas sp. OV546 TaxID=1881063 RepID=UPI0008E012C9|nr:head maturation protease, ClpP-related [Pseudomonas sp. OV546]SFU95314.1 ATP-dependent protease ClpP, protease subunit [Pseudomonas sp. OV546]
MTLKTLPLAPQLQPCAQLSGEVRPLALERWNASIRAANEDKHSISIFDPIGFDPWTGEGVTAKRIAAALRTIDGADVTVNMNSPGGDMFEGLAIYNLLREYSGKVVVKVLGLAASAASIIAMAGDEVRIARAGFLNIHNCWVVAMGNRYDLMEMAERLAPFDQAMADIYAARTGDSQDAMQQLMNADSWIAGSAAVEQGFADGLLALDTTQFNAVPAGLLARRYVNFMEKRGSVGLPELERALSKLRAALASVR